MSGCEVKHAANHPRAQTQPCGLTEGSRGASARSDANLPDNVRVITLPAYSPELNPIEGLWEQIKDRRCNLTFDTLAELEAVLQTEWQHFWQNARHVQSLVFETPGSSKRFFQTCYATPLT